LLRLLVGVHGPQVCSDVLVGLSLLALGLVLLALLVLLLALVPGQEQA
jgi:hypothetical protein